MNFLDEIYEGYRTLDEWLASQKKQARPSGVIPWWRMSELNDYAFFVLLFGQLEDYINREYEQQIEPWEDASFAHRVNCLLGRDSKETGLILDYYDLRCDIAHGHAESGQMGEKIPLTKVYEDIVEIIA
jgi:hypothetical protein